MNGVCLTYIQSLTGQKLTSINLDSFFTNNELKSSIKNVSRKGAKFSQRPQNIKKRVASPLRFLAFFSLSALREIIN